MRDYLQSSLNFVIFSFLVFSGGRRGKEILLDLDLKLNLETNPKNHADFSLLRFLITKERPS